MCLVGLKILILLIKNDFFIVNFCVFDVNYFNCFLVGLEMSNKFWK